MPATAQQSPRPPRAALIPDERVVRARLLAVCREARLLRRLLELSRQAGEIAPESVAPAGPAHGGRP